MANTFTALAKNAVAEIGRVFDAMTEDDVRPLLGAIQAARRVFLMGAGREGISTRAFAMRLMHLGKETHWVWDDTTPSIGAGDLFICPCGSANVGHVNYVAGMAKANGASVALLTPSNEGALLDAADIVCRVPAAAYKAVGDFVPSAQPMGNLFEQTLFVLYDVLVMMLREEMHVAPEQMVSRHRNVE